LSQVFSAPPEKDGRRDRLPPDRLDELRRELAASGFALAAGEAAMAELRRLRGLYEPFAFALADYLLLELPPWIKTGKAKDNWQTTAWQSRSHAAMATPVQDEHL
jgi:hypothetical protein